MKKLSSLAIAVVVLLTFAACSGSGNEPPNAVSSTDVPTSPPTVSTTAQKDVLAAAKRYLNTAAFSHQELVKQLQFDGFTIEEIAYGISNCGANWEEQARNRAKAYLEASYGFSYQRMIEYLENENHFTNEESVYAADNCGANWKEQAVICAKNVLENTISVYSYQELIEHLKINQFTEEEAVYGAKNSD